VANIRLSKGCSLTLTLLVIQLIWCTVASGENNKESKASHPTRPVLTIDPGMHTAPIRAAAVDVAGRFIVTVSDDKTVRIWDADNGSLRHTIYMPAGPNRVGQMYAVAIEPKGSLVAAAGFTAQGEDSWIYLINASTGVIEERFVGTPAITTKLAFSADGRYLAAGTFGLRIFDRTRNWSQVFVDDNEAPIYGMAFAQDGRLASSSGDGTVRLYSPDFRLISKYKRSGGGFAWSVAFRPPDGDTLAVGFTRDDAFGGFAPLDLRDGRTLASLPRPGELEHSGNLDPVEWSADGATLYCGQGGLMTWAGRGSPLLAIDKRGLGSAHEFGDEVGLGVVSIAAMSNGRLMIAATAKPYLGVLNADGRIRWQRRTPTTDFSGYVAPIVAVSKDGNQVDFRFGAQTQVLRFDVPALKIADVTNEWPLERPFPASESRLDIKLFDEKHPLLNGKPLMITSGERASCIAIDPSDHKFILGTDDELYSFTDKGALSWRRFVPNRVGALKVTGNGQLVVAALADGTIRWYRYADGFELMAFMPLHERSKNFDERLTLETMKWVAWTPDGFYAASPGTDDVLKWVVDRGPSTARQSVPVSTIPRQNRPDAIALLLREMDIVKALGLADYSSAREAVRSATGAGMGPGVRLHVLSIGINNYGDHAANLHLNYAEKDAEEFAETLDTTQRPKLGKSGIYAGVLPTYIPSQQATKQYILAALESVQRNMANGDNQDLAVVLFAGHGMTIDGTFYLLPNGVDTSSRLSVEASAIPIAQFREQLEGLAAHGEVILLLDACHSGAATNGLATQSNTDTVRDTFQGNIVVMTSSKGTEVSREYPELGHGAFTYLLIQAIKGAADGSNTGKISIVDLVSYLSEKLPNLTHDEQHLGVGPVDNFQRTLFQVTR